MNDKEKDYQRLLDKVNEVFGDDIDRFPDFAPLRVSAAVELVEAGQVEDAKRIMRMAYELNTDLRVAVLDHPR